MLCGGLADSSKRAEEYQGGREGWRALNQASRAVNEASCLPLSRPFKDRFRLSVIRPAVSRKLLTSSRKGGVILSMDSQATLFEMPEASSPALETWQDRLSVFKSLAEAREGLIARSALADLFGVSRSRVAQLCDKGQLEVINFCGVQFVSGRSIRDWKEGEKQKGGRGHRRVSIWKSLKAGAHLGAGLANAIVPD